MGWIGMSFRVGGVWRTWPLSELAAYNTGGSTGRV